MLLALGHMINLSTLHSTLFLSFLFVLLSSDFTVGGLVWGLLWVLLVAEVTSGSLPASLFIRFFFTVFGGLLFL